MAFLGKLFGGSSGSSAAKNTRRQAPLVPQETAAEKLANTIETLERREGVLEKRIAAEETKAKECVAKNQKKQALACLKKKKMYEGQLDKLSSQKMNLEHLEMQMQEAAVVQDVVRAQQAAVGNLSSGINVEDVEVMRDKLADAMDAHEEVQQILGEPLGNDLLEDDDALMAEFEQMQKEVGDEQMLGITSDLSGVGGISIPSAPLPVQAQPAQAAVAEDDDDAALAELAAELNA